MTEVEPSTDRGDGIVQIRLPMAGNPLRSINAYVLADTDGLTLIDAGWKADDVFAALVGGLRAHGSTLGDVRRLLVTHCHFDHYGLAATLLRAGVPELHLHANDWNLAREHLADPAAVDAAADAWIARNGLRVEGLLDDELQHHRTELAAPTHGIADGTRIGRLRALWTPGHTPGHVCFVDERSGALFSGDHILDPITPHVGIWRETDDDPLGRYVAALHRTAATGASHVFPAHGEPFPDLGRRVGELLDHEATRERHVIDALAALPSRTGTAADVARRMPWTRRRRALHDLSDAHQQFAVAETIAHLRHLERAGAVARTDAGATIVYRMTPSA